MQIHIVGKGCQLAECTRARRQPKRIAEVNLAQADTVLFESVERFLWLLKFHSKMAGVVIHAQMTVQAGVARTFFPHLIEKPGRLQAVLQQPERFGFHAQVELAAGPVAYTRDVLDATPQVIANLPLLLGLLYELLK